MTNESEPTGRCRWCNSPPWAWIHRWCECGCGDYIGHRYEPEAYR